MQKKDLKTLAFKPKNLFERLNKSNIFYPILVFLIFAFWQITWGLKNNPDFINWPIESLNIAKSIVEGQGYSSPFCYETGPTAWVSPLIPLFYAVTLIVFGQSIWAYLFLGLVGKVLIAMSFYFLQGSFEKYQIPYNRFILFLIFMTYFSVFTRRYIGFFSDVELFILFTGLVLYYSHDLIHNNRLKEFLILSFIIPLSLTSFALPFVTFFIVLFIFWLIKHFFGFNPIQINHKLKFKHFLVTGLIFLLSVSIWGIRNNMVFDRIIVAKSNTWFEFHMSNIVDKKGFLNNSTWRKEHPMDNELLCKTILKEGEVQWLEQFENPGQGYQSLNNPDYVRKVMNRLKNIFLFTDYSYDFISTEYLRELDDDIKEVLISEKIIMHDSYLTLQYPETEFWALLNSLSISVGDKEMLISDWNNAKQLLQKDKIAPTRIFHGFMRATLPSISIIALLILAFVGIFKHLEFFGISLTLYFSYFLPFILISHEPRYQSFVILLQIIFVKLFVLQLIKMMRINRLLKHPNLLHF